MQHGFFRPPRLQIVGFILREAAIIEDSFVCACLWIAYRFGFSTEVETYPIKQSSKPRTFVIEVPSASDTVQRSVLFIGSAVKRGYMPLFDVVIIDASRSATGNLLSFRNRKSLPYLFPSAWDILCGICQWDSGADSYNPPRPPESVRQARRWKPRS